LTGGDTSFVAPATLAGALDELGGEGAIAVGGGTSVAILLKSRMLEVRRLVYLGRIRELSGAGEQAGTEELAGFQPPGDAGRPAGEIRLGATLTLRELCRSPLVRSRLPVLVTAAAQVGNPRVRAVATVGGTMAHADPRQDLPPVLLALGARVVIGGPSGTREVPLAGFLHGFMETELEADELVTEVLIPWRPGLRACYRRFTPGSADDFPAVSVAAAVFVAPDGTVRSGRIALGGVGSTALLAADAASLLAGRPLEADAIEAAADAAASIAQPWGDRHGSADYKRQMVRVWTRRALESCAFPWPA
jgi:carbon-monoxide dehydrogenase medium subunit